MRARRSLARKLSGVTHSFTGRRSLGSATLIRPFNPLAELGKWPINYQHILKCLILQQRRCDRVRTFFAFRQTLAGRPNGWRCWRASMASAWASPANLRVWASNVSFLPNR